MKRSTLLKETLENMSMLRHEDLKKIYSVAQELLNKEPKSKTEWMQKELSTMTHYFNEMDLEDEVHFVHESQVE